jgi:RNA polymerase primary sigma factor
MACKPGRRGVRLSRADEVALARCIERGDAHAKETMIESNLGLVHAVARTFRQSGVPYADLVQEGTVGLIRAVDLFDHRRGVKFSTYATWWIRRAMHDAITGSKVIRMPARARRQLAAVRRAETQLGRHTPGMASDAAIADVTELSVDSVRSLRTAGQVVASLDQPVGDGTTALADLIADTRAVDPAESAIAHEQRDEVAAMLRLLPKRHREVLTQRYGLNGGPVRSHEEIGRRLGVGEERSRQIERESLHRLRSIAWTSGMTAAAGGPVGVAA